MFCNVCTLQRAFTLILVLFFISSSFSYGKEPVHIIIIDIPERNITVEIDNDPQPRSILNHAWSFAINHPVLVTTILVSTVLVGTYLYTAYLGGSVATVVASGNMLGGSALIDTSRPWVEQRSFVADIAENRMRENYWNSWSRLLRLEEGEFFAMNEIDRGLLITLYLTTLASL